MNKRDCNILFIGIICLVLLSILAMYLFLKMKNKEETNLINENNGVNAVNAVNGVNNGADGNGAKEEFYSSPGKAFSEYIPPQKCTPENNCFKGSYLRSQVYTNVCKGNCNAYDRLTREPVNIKNQCFRTLGDFPKQNGDFQCTVNEHGQRNCQWLN